jgi:phosphocarrier protein FPr/phosphocarrier protein
MSAVPTRLAIIAPLSGVLVPLDRVPDPVFAAGAAGDGIAIDPTSAVLLAPADGVVTQLHRAHHALAILTDAGIEVLVHLGIDSVALQGRGFTPRVAQGARVVVGQPLLTFDADFLATRVRSLLSPIVVTNGERVARMTAATGLVEAGRHVVLSLELTGTSPSAGVAGFAQTLGTAVRLPNRDGLHARPAAVLAAAAKQFRSDIQLLRGAARANAKSVVSLMLLAAERGDAVRIQATGADAGAAVVTLTALLATGCGEAQGGAEPRPPAPAVATARNAAGEFAGIAASPGVAVGRVVQVARVAITVDEQGAGVGAERARLDAALAEARREVAALRAGLGRDPHGQMLDAHIELLSDPELIDLAVAGLGGGQSAGYVWQRAYTDYAARLQALASPLLRERANDVRDVGQRVLAVLTGVQPAAISTPPDSILVADDLTPSETAALDRDRVLGLCTTGGSPTSHAAILARSLGIPAVCAIDRAARTLVDGTLVLVDGDRGTLQRDPGAAELARAVERRARLAAERAEERAGALAPALTTDGHHIEVAANIRDADEARAALAEGGEGVGLLRSEFLFADRATAPTEAEQAAAYRAVAAVLGRDRRLVIRTLDVGGDKPLEYLPLPAEANPFLGLRGIRVGLAQPELLRVQLRAILAAAPHADLHVMFPMVATLEELRAARQLLDETAAGSGARVHVGIMIEVPSAALIADRFAAEVDFLSIGTNDLTQYTLAMDRGHPALAAHADALHPAVLRLIAMTADAAHRHGKWVGLCGGLAAEPLATAALVGLGVDELSVAVPAIAAVKARLRRLSRMACQGLAAELLEMGTAGEVRARLAAFNDRG